MPEVTIRRDEHDHDMYHLYGVLNKSAVYIATIHGDILPALLDDDGAVEMIQYNEDEATTIVLRVH